MKAKQSKQNVSTKQLNITKWTLEWSRFKIVQADKKGATVIINTKEYDDKLNEHLKLGEYKIFLKKSYSIFRKQNLQSS